MSSVISCLGITVTSLMSVSYDTYELVVQRGARSGRAERSRGMERGCQAGARSSYCKGYPLVKMNRN
jgi:hypothetical protein